jgi:hypothetical protein
MARCDPIPAAIVLRKGRNMTKTNSNQHPQKLLEQLDELVDQSIDSMSPAQLKKFRKDRKKIMQNVTRRAAASRVPPESAESEKQARRA